MHPIPGTGAIKAKQHTQQIERRVAFAVEQDVEQLVSLSGTHSVIPIGCKTCRFSCRR
jgi:hypothetical protein